MYDEYDIIAEQAEMEEERARAHTVEDTKGPIENLPIAKAFVRTKKARVAMPEIHDEEMETIEKDLTSHKPRPQGKSRRFGFDLAAGLGPKKPKRQAGFETIVPKEEPKDEDMGAPEEPVKTEEPAPAPEREEEELAMPVFVKKERTRVTRPAAAYAPAPAFSQSPPQSPRPGAPGVRSMSLSPVASPVLGAPAANLVLANPVDLFAYDSYIANHPGRVVFYGQAATVDADTGTPGSPASAAIVVHSVPMYELYFATTESSSCDQAQLAKLEQGWAERVRLKSGASHRMTSVADIICPWSEIITRGSISVVEREYIFHAAGFDDVDVPHGLRQWVRVLVPPVANDRVTWGRGDAIQDDLLNVIKSNPHIRFVSGVTFTPEQRIQIALGIKGPTRIAVRNLVANQEGMLADSDGKPVQLPATSANRTTNCAFELTFPYAKVMSGAVFELSDAHPVADAYTLHGVSLGLHRHKMKRRVTGELVDMDECELQAGEIVEDHVTVAVTDIPDISLAHVVPYRHMLATTVYTTMPEPKVPLPAAGFSAERPVYNSQFNGLTTPLTTAVHEVIKSQRGINVQMRHCKSASMLAGMIFQQINSTGVEVLLGHGLEGTMRQLVSYCFSDIATVGAKLRGGKQTMAKLRLYHLCRGPKGQAKMAVEAPNSQWTKRANSMAHSVNPMRIAMTLPKTVLREFTKGRLFIDTDTVYKEISTTHIKTDNLLELAELSGATDRTSEHSQYASFYESCRARGLPVVAARAVEGAILAMGLAQRENMIPLMAQLAMTTGHTLNRVLTAGRAERIEAILNHAFNDKARYVLPDRISMGRKTELDAEAGDDKGGKKPKYKGGVVLDPVRGMHNSGVLLLDFNSLYPSIIIAHNLCHVTSRQIARQLHDTASPAEDGEATDIDDEDATDVDEPMEDSTEETVIPKVIEGLVQDRRTVRGLMRDPEMDEKQRDVLNTKQLALKICANSMYGSLGFRLSRYYAETIARRVTEVGRGAIIAAKAAAEKSRIVKDGVPYSFEVVYGDTDSIMVKACPSVFIAPSVAHNATPAQVEEDRRKILTNYRRLESIADEIAEIVARTPECKGLQLGLDGIMASILLVNKKKYAANMAYKVGDGDHSHVAYKHEVKGLDLVRRDAGRMASEVSARVIKALFEEQSYESAIEATIRDFFDGPNSPKAILQRVSETPKEELKEEDLALFTMGGMLSKDPEDYRTKPIHAVAALRNPDKVYKKGAIINYLLTKDTQGAIDLQHFISLSQTERPEIDLDAYLIKKVHGALERLLVNPDVCFDRMSLAAMIGIQNLSAVRLTEHREATASAGFSDVPPFVVVCPECGHGTAWPSWSNMSGDSTQPLIPGKRLNVLRDTIDAEGIPRVSSVERCHNSTCRHKFTPTSVAAQFQCFVLRLLTLHNSGLYTCSDPQCRYNMSVINDELSKTSDTKLIDMLGSGSISEIHSVVTKDHVRPLTEIRLTAKHHDKCLNKMCGGTRSQVLSAETFAQTMAFYSRYFRESQQLFTTSKSAKSPNLEQWEGLARVAEAALERNRVTRLSLGVKVDKDTVKPIIYDLTHNGCALPEAPAAGVTEAADYERNQFAHLLTVGTWATVRHWKPW
ncbi:DNA polymerase A, POLA1 [Carpediemonas membranifera]|uniref:DNA polymerase n=1 Tax=Carpediemonas membranifera TaxID=201153 RepID=A0A8J6DZU5_9EUKA|nr:DNA polymerase A, POLA1 [Carpediemonas membranifera]|eukprot:KAG9390911.1 DNA polymerase A, POLA1 [Carpediemonas membranifera]